MNGLPVIGVVLSWPLIEDVAPFNALLPLIEVLVILIAPQLSMFSSSRDEVLHRSAEGIRVVFSLELQATPGESCDLRRKRFLFHCVPIARSLLTHELYRIAEEGSTKGGAPRWGPS